MILLAQMQGGGAEPAANSAPTPKAASTPKKPNDAKVVPIEDSSSEDEKEKKGDGGTKGNAIVRPFEDSDEESEDD